MVNFLSGWMTCGEITSGCFTGQSLESPSVTDTRALGMWDMSTHLGFRGLVLTGEHVVVWPRKAKLSERRKCWGGAHLMCAASAQMYMKCLVCVRYCSRGKTKRDKILNKTWLLILRSSQFSGHDGSKANHCNRKWTISIEATKKYSGDADGVLPAPHPFTVWT